MVDINSLKNMSSNCESLQRTVLPQINRKGNKSNLLMS